MPAITIRPPRILPDLARGNRTVGLGDSIMRGLGSSTEYGRRSWFEMGCIFSNQRIRFAGNLGADGETTSQIFARVPDVISLAPAKCVIYAGTNDVIGQVSQSTIWANLTAIYRQLRGVGIEPIACTILPIYLPGYETTYRSAIQQLNAWIAWYSEQNGMHCLDLYGAMVDPSTGDFVAGYDTDGEHPHGTGARVLGQLMATKLAPVYPEVRPWLTSVKTDTWNLITNGVFSGDTNEDGLADSWGRTGSGTGLTQTLEVDADIVGNWQKLVVTQEGQRLLQQSISASSAWSVGDRVAFMGRIKATLEAGSMWAYCTLSFLNAGGSTISSLWPINNWSLDIADGTFYLEGAIPSGCASMFLNIGSGSSGTGTVQVAQMTIRNLTKLGLA